MARRRRKIERILPDADILNPMQRAVYEVIRKYVEENNISPSIREIAALVGISKSNVPNILTVLEKKGFLHQIPNTPRGIVLTLRAAPGSVSIPIIGTIAAGVPVFAPENYDGSIELSADFVPRGELFALTIRGDSMTGANILNGDLAIIKREI